MGHLASKVKGDSPRLPSCHPWSEAPCGSWVIRFSPGGPFTQKPNKVAEIKGLPLYHWPSPDWVTGDAFNTLMFVVVQIFLEGNHNRLMSLMEEPLEAAEMIAQFNTFITSTNQDMMELQNQLFEAAHENIYLHLEGDQLMYLDLLITNPFDPQYQLRAVLSRKSRSSKSSLLHSVSSKIKSKLARLKKKSCRRSPNTPAQPSIPVSSNTPPLRPTAPGLSEFIERTESVTFNDGVDNTNEIPVVDISDNSIINGTKDGERESYEAERMNNGRKSEVKSVNLQSNLSSSYLSLPVTSDIIIPMSEVISSEQSPNELIAKQRSVCCTEVSPEASSDTSSSFTVVAENEPFLPPKESSENEKNAGYGSCLQEDASEDADIHVWHAEVEEPDSSNSGQFYGNAPSGTIFTVKSVEYDDQHGPVCCDVSAGAKHADSSEYNKYNDPPCTDVSSGSRYVDSNDNNNMHIHVGQACIDSTFDFKQAELDEQSEDNGPPCIDNSPGSKHAYSFEPNKYNDPACTDVPSGSRYGLSSEHSNDSGPLTNVDNGPTCTDNSSGSKHAYSFEPNKYNDPACTDVPSGSRYGLSSEHSNDSGPLTNVDNGPTCTDNSSGSKHAYSFEPNKYNDPACTDVPSGSRYGLSSEHSNDSGPLTNVDNGPTSSTVTSDLKYAAPSEPNNDDGLTCSDVHSGSEQVDSHENNHINAPVNVESSPGTIHEESNLEKENNGPVHEEVSPGTSQHYNSKEPVNAMAPKQEQRHDQCTFLPIYGLSKHCLRSTTQEVSTAAQGLLSNIKEEKEEHSDDEPQMHQPSSSSFACLPFHGLSRGSFSSRQKGAATGVQTQKRKADSEVDRHKLADKRLKLGDSFCEARRGGDNDPCHSTSEGADTCSDMEKPNSRGTTKQASTDAQGKCANVKEEHGTKPLLQKPSPSSFGFLPFHGLSRGSFSLSWQGAPTGVQTRKRQANTDEANGIEPVAKRFKAGDICEMRGKSDPCHSSSEGVDSLNDTELNPTCDTVDDTERVGGDDSSSSESIEWHDALEDTCI